MGHPKLKEYIWFDEGLDIRILHICLGKSWNLWAPSLIIKTREHAKLMGMNFMFLLFLLLQCSESNHLTGCGSKDARKVLVFKKVTCLTQFWYLPIGLSLLLDLNEIWLRPVTRWQWISTSSSIIVPDSVCLLLYKVRQVSGDELIYCLVCCRALNPDVSASLCSPCTCDGASKVLEQVEDLLSVKNYFLSELRVELRNIV